MLNVVVNLKKLLDIIKEMNCIFGHEKNEECLFKDCTDCILDYLCKE
jgi:hypothetical protein